MSTSVEDRMSTPPPNPYHLGPNSSCAVCVGDSHKHHTQKAYLFLVIYTSVETLVATKEFLISILTNTIYSIKGL